MPSYSAAVFISRPEDFIRLWIRGLRTEWERKSRNRKQESGGCAGDS